MDQPKVALTRVGDHSKEEIYRVLRKWIPDIISLTSLKTPRRVVIKVNLCAPLSPETGATTDVKIVDSLITYINEINPHANIFIVESETGHSANMRFRKTGYYMLKEKYGNVQLVDLTKSKQVVVKDRRLKYFKSGLEISHMFSGSFFISIAKLKTHEFERYTGVLKNQFGCISTRNRGQYHSHLSDVITDVNTIINPDLCVIDCLIAMEGKGPTSGNPKKMNLLIVGNDPVATDAVGAMVMGINSRGVPHLNAAAKRGLGEIRLKNIQILGEKIGNIKEEFLFIPEISYHLLRLSFKIAKLPLPIHVTSPVEELLRRLARSLYKYRLTTILTKKVIPTIIEKIKSS